MGLVTKNSYGPLGQTISNLGGFWSLGTSKLTVSLGRASGLTNGNARLFGLGYDHSLSKRTTLYATAGRIHNLGSARFNLGGARAGGVVAVDGQDSTGYDFGIRHAF